MKRQFCLDASFESESNRTFAVNKFEDIILCLDCLFCFPLCFEFCPTESILKLETTKQFVVRAFPETTCLQFACHGSTFRLTRGKCTFLYKNCSFSLQNLLGPRNPHQVLLLYVDGRGSHIFASREHSAHCACAAVTKLRPQTRQVVYTLGQRQLQTATASSKIDVCSLKSTAKNGTVHSPLQL